MNKQSSWERAVQQYEAANHFLNVTFPSLQDPKLFMGIINNIFSSLEAGMDTIIIHQNKLVPKKFSEKLEILRYMVPHDYLNLMLNLKTVIEYHKKSPIEFRRRGAFVICDKEYEVRSLKVSRELSWIGKRFNRK